MFSIRVTGLGIVYFSFPIPCAAHLEDESDDMDSAVETYVLFWQNNP